MEKKSRAGETFVTALINRLTEAKRLQGLGHTRDIVVSIPQHIASTNLEAQKIMKLSGEMNRTPELHLAVDLETSTTDGRNREQLKLFDLVFHITSQTDLDRAISLLER